MKHTLKYSEETFHEMYEALKKIKAWLLYAEEVEIDPYNPLFADANNLTLKAIARAEGRNDKE